MNKDVSKELYDTNVECIYCGKAFLTKKVSYDAIKVKSRESDRHVYYESLNPNHYDVFVCPHCGIAFVSSFGELSSFEKKILKESYISKVRDYRRYCGERNIEDVIRSYKLALFAAELTDRSSSIIAGLSLRLAWIYRELGNQENEKRFMEIALTYFEKEYEYGYGDENNDFLLYIIAELNIRLDNFERTKKWINVIFSNRNIASNIKAEIKDRWLDYKTYKEAQVIEEKGQNISVEA